ncbi:unnamed protein product [Zymoseptoria tritici ST99CH_1A5]|uniref:Uncharacterized protein n=1 Tax=Zymoseptoria tritici ST99CH_1A5 TaxID=1276529 RepID=A0A1Y6M0L6_ZYMTR|nr:unnamed protein product [Zymoseptoria tritici ST99CH_1A5]
MAYGLGLPTPPDEQSEAQRAMTADHSRSSFSGSDSAWERTSSNSDTSSVYSPSSDSSTSSASDIATHRLRSLRAEVELLVRDNEYFDQLPSVRSSTRSSALKWTILRVAVPFAAICLVVLAWTVALCPGQNQVVHFEYDQDLVPTIRPSDFKALAKIGFNLPARWMEWINEPPLGMSHWWQQDGANEPGTVQYQLLELRELGASYQKREKKRKGKRQSWAKDLAENADWVERVERCSQRGMEMKDSAWIKHQFASVADALLPHPDGRSACRTLQSANPTRMKNLGKLVDDVLNHLPAELETLEFYLDAMASLQGLSEAQINIVNKEIRAITVKAAERRSDSILPVFSWRAPSPIALLSDSEKTHIALAREEYGVLTFLSLLSYALQPAMRERREKILGLRAQLESLKDQISATGPLDQRSRTLTVATGLPSMHDLDVVIREKHLNVQTIRSFAKEWKRTRTLDLKKDQSSSNQCLGYSPIKSSTTIFSRIRSSSIVRLPFSSTPYSHKLARVSRRLHHLVWTDPNTGAASWHWEGSGPSSHGLVDQKRRIEKALLFAGLDLGGPGVDEVAEKRRYQMIPREDGEDVRLSWEDDYKSKAERV